MCYYLFGFVRFSVVFCEFFLSFSFCLFIFFVLVIYGDQ